MWKNLGKPYIKINRIFKKLKIAELEHLCLYIHAPTGFGKTAAVQYYYRNKKVYYLSGEKGFLLEKREVESIEEDVIVIDDISWITDSPSQEYIRKLIHDSGKNIVLIGRNKLPEWMMNEYVSGLLLMADEKDLNVDEEHIVKFMKAYGLDVDAVAVRNISNYCNGYPLGIQMACLMMKEMGGYNENLLEEMIARGFHYFDSKLFEQWEDEARQFLLSIADFEVFDIGLAAMVSGNSDASVLLEYFIKVGDFIDIIGDGQYQFRPLMTKYLCWKRSICWSEKKILEIHRRAALYFQLNDEIERALEQYKLVGDNDKITDLLIKNAGKHPGVAHFYEMRSYYFSLSEEKIMEYPVLMAGMSMLYSLMLQPEKSEKWYECLVEYAKNKNLSGKKMREAKMRLVYLDIALPHRGIKGMISVLKSAAMLCVDNNMILPDFSVTSNLPSLMNGGKDFCDWTKHDKELAKIMKRPVEIVLGKCGMGLVSIALAESAFEKSSMEDYEIMSLISSGCMKAETEGKIEINFAGTGILAKLHVSHNHPALAKRLLQGMRKRAKQESAYQILSNLEAMEIWIALQQGDIQAARVWIKERAPDETVDFSVLNRYCYMVKLRCYLALGEDDAAWNLSEKLKYYFERYDRHYMWMENMVLRAILSYRLGRPQWKEILIKALKKAKEYHFIWLVAQEGIAVKPLLEEYKLPDSEYGKALGKAVNNMAVFYPRYLGKISTLEEPLTNMESRILKLHCERLTTKEILELLSITERTLKFHNTNIYRKLGAKNKQEAVYLAKQMGFNID